MIEYILQSKNHNYITRYIRVSTIRYLQSNDLRLPSKIIIFYNFFSNSTLVLINRILNSNNWTDL